ncbi:DUF6289 family protein [Stackebrandtia soli]|uniref:DUF6289 family protein n=1 Tax=Stackebrandtia soli TaxID=1892856 RepID=UPI0039E8B5CB
MPTIIRRALTLAASTVAVTAMALAPSSPAMAIPACPVDSQCDYVYYATAERLHVVGGWTMFCDGGSDMWGTRSPYLSFHSIPCG